MRREFFQGHFIGIVVLGIATLLATTSVFAMETNNAPTTSAAPTGVVVVAVDTNLLQQFRTELLTSLRASEKARLEAEATARHNTESMVARMNFMEQSLRVRSDHELESVKAWNQFILIIVSSVGGLGVLGILFVAIFLSRALSRLADVTAVVRPNTPPEPGHSLPMLGVGEMHAERPSLAEQSSLRVLGAIDRLQRQIDDLERLAKAPLAPSELEHGGEPAELSSATEFRGEFAETPRSTRVIKGDRVGSLLGKGQALIHLNHADEALTCFEQALLLDPNNLDALVKRGTALERLGRTDEAIQSYDRAIALDQSLTTAYLHKGGVFNRLGRHNEALQCYEQALRTQEAATR